MRIPTRSTRRDPGPGQLALPGFPAPLPAGKSRALRSVPTGPSALTASAAPAPALPRPQRPLGLRPTGPGELHGPATTSRQVRAITVRVEQIDQGRWRFTQPRVPGWVAVGYRAPDVVAALRQGFTEAQVAAYSDWRNTVYDSPDVGAYRRSKPLTRSKRRCDVYEVDAWKLDLDGRWVSPKGLRFREDRQVVQRVIEQRRRLGLPARPDPVQPDTTASARPAGPEPVDLDALGRKAAAG